MQDVNLLQGLVKRVGDCRAVHDDPRIGLKGVRSSGSITVRVFILRAIVRSDVQSYNHVRLLLEPARAAALVDHHVTWQYSARSHCSLQFASLQV
jgi:hypothetical protein